MSTLFFKFESEILASVALLLIECCRYNHVIIARNCETFTT